MNTLNFIPLVQVLIGAGIILLSITIALRIRKDVSSDLRKKWLIAITLMGFFVLGYLLFIFAPLYRIWLHVEQIAGIIFLGGAVFVYIIMKLSEISINRITQQDRDIQVYAQGLEKKTDDLEREIIDRRKAEEQAQQRLQHLTALHTIDMSISSSLALDVIMRVFLEQVVDRLNIDAACVLLLDPNTQILSYFYGIGFRSEQIRKTSVRVGEGTAGIAALERRILSIENIGEDSETFTRSDETHGEGFVTYCVVPLIAKAEVRGVLEIFHRKRLNPDTEWWNFLNALALQAAIAVDNTTLFNDLQRSNVELLIAYDSTLEGWARALELRDKETEGHTRRVVEKTLEVAKKMRMSESELVHVRRGALLHDIGKMSIPDDILLKTGALTDEEMAIMRRHPVKAFEMLSPIVYLRPALDIPYCHHERWDGAGYPRELKGEQIPLAARIFAVVDTWDALHHERRYHPGWTREKTCEHISSLAGTQFDPAVVEAFMDLECSEDI